MRLVVAVDGPRGGALSEGLTFEGHEVLLCVPADEPASFAADRMPQPGDTFATALESAEVLVLEASRTTLTAMLVGLCDRRGIRIQPLGDAEDTASLTRSFGLADPLPVDVDVWRLADALLAAPRTEPVETSAPRHPRVIAVWGPEGAPGRSTLAIELAVELARGGHRVGLVDADTRAPSLALQLGLADEGPGFAAACRQTERGGLDAHELSRIAVPLGSPGVEVLTGLNRPSRWPELTESRVADALAACRDWADYTVVDVAASLERDEEIISDLDGPRRNAATLAALRTADSVVAVAAADPVGVARFLRAHAELRGLIGATPVTVVANRLRPGALGIDARGQVRRALDRFGGIGDVWFVPADARSADSALLAARPIAEVAPKSPLTLAVRRVVGEALAPVAAPVRMPRARRMRMPRAAGKAA